MPSPWISLQDAYALAKDGGIEERKVVNGLMNGELHTLATDLCEYPLSKVECNLSPPDPSSNILYIGSRTTSISISELIAPLDLGERQELIGADLYTIVRYDNRAEIWFAGDQLVRQPRVPLDPHFWNLAEIYSSQSLAVADDLHGRVRRKASGVLVDRADLARIITQFNGGFHSGEKVSVGRPTVTNWEKVALEIVRIYRQDHGSIKSQADLIGRVRAYLNGSPAAARGGPSDSALKDHTKPFYDLLWPKI